MSHQLVWDVDHVECQDCWEAGTPCPYLAVLAAARALVESIRRLEHPDEYPMIELIDAVRALDQGESR